MKAFFATVLAALSVQIVVAHYTIPDFINEGAISADWVYIRETANHYSNGPVTSVTDPEFRCYELDLQNTAGQTQTATVTAGSTVGFQANGPIYHPGYLDVYMSKADPAANSPEAGTGQTWFKVWEDAPTFSSSTRQLTFPSTTMTQFTFTIPSSLPSGQYLIRAEQIALHVASTYGGAQFYISCAQVNVVNGGSGTPGPLVSIPGVYTGYEPGILINIYNLPANFTGYQAPGPAVWRG
ncbi:glycoside hydrolase family 61 protein D [Abortiporus biennis]|nr:glycoside hydrolase family 61 protein D [Abortiporus biennis]